MFAMRMLLSLSALVSAIVMSASLLASPTAAANTRAEEASVDRIGGTDAGSGSGAGALAFEDSKRLYAWLLSRERYNRLVRPLGAHSEQLTVYLGLRLSQLIDVVRFPAHIQIHYGLRTTQLLINFWSAAVSQF